MERILVTGARGYLASLAQLYNAGRYEFVRVSHTDVDFRDPTGVERFFREKDFDVCLHMAADATTAHCEQDPEGTHRVNTESAIAIARVCRERGKRVVFISTEQCFNASSGEAPFSEDDEQASTTRYGQQKMEADAWIREHLDDYLILRFSWMFGLALPGVRPSPNILTNVMSVLRSGEPAAFRVHERRNMTYAQRFAGQLPQILALPSGAYHFASQNGDYLGWIAVSDGNGGGDNIQAIRQQNGFKAYACDGRIVVEGAEGHYTVHAVSGQQVPATAHLSRGIYIVNGKKVAKK